MSLLKHYYCPLIFFIVFIMGCSNGRNPIAVLDTKSCELKTISSKQYFESISVVSINGKRIDKEMNLLKDKKPINSINLCKVLNDAGINIREIGVISFGLEKKKNWLSFPQRGPKPIVIFTISKQQLSRIGTDEKLFFYSTLK